HAARDVFLQRIDNEAQSQRTPSRPRKLRHGRMRDPLDVSLRLGKAHARPQPRDRTQVIAPLRRIGVRNMRRVVLIRRPDLRSGREYVVETARHNANHRVAVAVERDLPADHGTISAESPLPKAVAKDRNVRPVVSIVRGLKIPAHRGRDTQRAKISVTCILSVEPLGLSCSRHGRLPGLEYGKRIEGTVPFKEFAIIVETYVRARALKDAPNHHDSFWMRIRQRLEQNGIHRAENCSVRANSQSQSQRGHRRESGRLAQCAHAVAHVLKQRFQPAPAPLIARHFPDYARVAKLPPRRLLRLPRSLPALLPLARRHTQMVLDLLAEFVFPAP